MPRRNAGTLVAGFPEIVLTLISPPFQSYIIPRETFWATFSINDIAYGQFGWANGIIYLTKTCVELNL